MNNTFLSSGYGVCLFLIYAVFIWGLTWIFAKRYRTTKTQFLVAERSLGVWEAALSIAATWIWAPALFIAAQKAYTHGIAGVFWFTVPNVLCLIIFAFFAQKLRNRLPQGFTLSDYILKRYSPRVHNLYLLELGGLAACSFAVQLLAGGMIIAALTGFSFLWITIIMAALVLSYSVFSGLKASVVTDYAQMIMILLVGSILIPWAVWQAGGWQAVEAGFGGISGKFSSIISKDGTAVAFSFGIPVTIGLMAGPFGDQSFWQRAFAVKKTRVTGAFIRAAMLFAVVPLLMSLLGFLAAGAGWLVADPAKVNLETIIRLLPAWTIIPFSLMLLSGLMSTQDSCLCAIAALVVHDLPKRFTGKEKSEKKEKLATELNSGRWAMVALTILAVVIANIPGLKILHLFLFYGTLRAATLLPTIMTLLSERISEPGIFWGILTSIIIGLPLFAYGKMTGNLNLAVAASIFTVLGSGIISLTATRLSKD
jgi:urea-proton symporter